MTITTSTPPQTTPTTVSGLTTGIQKTSNQKATLATDFTQFLTLLTTQLQNQDPLNPMDSNEFTNQLVQFSQVEQQINTNQKLDSMLSLQLSSATSVALGYVGLDASYVSSELNFDGSGTVPISLSLASPAESATMRIYNEEGEEVYSKDIGLATGRQDLTWDGKNQDGEVVPAGTYSIKVDALGPDDKSITATTVVKGNVRGIETQDGQILLLIGDRSVPMANVLNASVPPKTADRSETASTTGNTTTNTNTNTSTNTTTTTAQTN